MCFSKGAAFSTAVSFSYGILSEGKKKDSINKRHIFETEGTLVALRAYSPQAREGASI